MDVQHHDSIITEDYSSISQQKKKMTKLIQKKGNTKKKTAKKQIEKHVR